MVAQMAKPLSAAIRRGLRVVALGGSVTASYGGCFGSGCDPGSTLGEQPWLGPGRAHSQGFLASFMRAVNATWPHHGHTLTNRAVGGNGPSLVLSCLHSFVPESTDLVIIDFAINFGDERAHSLLLSKLASLSKPPLALILANFFWCRNVDGSDARWQLAADAKAMVARTATANVQQYAACAAPDAALRIARAHGHSARELRGLRSLVGPCGAVGLLSVYDALAPQIVAEQLSLRSVTADGYHPPLRPGGAVSIESTPLVTASSRLLIDWLQTAVLHGGLVVLRLQAETGLSPEPTRCKAPDFAMHRCYGAHSWMPRPIELARGSWQLEKRVVIRRASTAAERARRAWARKPGWLSTNDTRQQSLTFGVAAQGRLIVELFFLHSPDPAMGMVSLRCQGGCTCAHRLVNTRWRHQHTGDAKTALEVDHQRGGGACRLNLTHKRGGRVKFTSVTVRQWQQ